MSAYQGHNDYDQGHAQNAGQGQTDQYYHDDQQGQYYEQHEGYDQAGGNTAPHANHNDGYYDEG